MDGEVRLDLSDPLHKGVLLRRSLVWEGRDEEELADGGEITLVAADRVGEVYRLRVDGEDQLQLGNLRTSQSTGETYVEPSVDGSDLLDVVLA